MSESLTLLTNITEALYDASEDALRCLVLLRAFGQHERRTAQFTLAVTEATQPFLDFEVSRQFFLMMIGLVVSPLSIILLSVAIVNRTDDNSALAIGKQPRDGVLLL